MSDFYIFGMGLLVSLFVTSAVGLLLWGAASEPRGGLLPTKQPNRIPPDSRSVPPAPVPAPSLEA